MNKLVVLLACAAGWTTASSTSLTAKPCDYCNAQMREQALEYLRKYDDPVQREWLLPEAREQERGSLEEFARRINLDAEQFGRLLEMLANQRLENRVAWERCHADPACDVPPGIGDMFPRHEKERATILGAAGLKEYHLWTSVILERRFVRALGGRLSTYSPLSEAQSSALLAAVRQVRIAVKSEFKESGQKYSVYGDCGTLMLLYAVAPTLDEQVASGRAYVQRVHDQLATVLYEDQFPVFDQMQHELPSDMRQVLKAGRNPER